MRRVKEKTDSPLLDDSFAQAVRLALADAEKHTHAGVEPAVTVAARACTEAPAQAVADRHADAFSSAGYLTEFVRVQFPVFGPGFRVRVGNGQAVFRRA